MLSQLLKNIKKLQGLLAEQRTFESDQLLSVIIYEIEEKIKNKKQKKYDKFNS